MSRWSWVGLVVVGGAAFVLGREVGRSERADPEERSAPCAPDDVRRERSGGGEAGSVSGVVGPTTETSRDEQDVNAMRTRLAAAYLVGGAADPVAFPEGLPERYGPAAARAWADTLSERCPSAVRPVVEVDCGEFPCVVGLAWVGDIGPRDVVCDWPELAGGTSSKFRTTTEHGEVQGVLLAFGPQTLPQGIEREQLDRRWDLRRRAMSSWLMGAVGQD